MYNYISGNFIYGDDMYVPDYYMDERWWYTDVPGYMVSDHARVWSERTKRFLKLKRLDRHGHLGVCLQYRGKAHYYYIHRLVAKAFLPNPHHYPVVRHLDDDPENNELDNLAWGTQRDNAEDAKRNGKTFLADPEIRDKALDSVRLPILAVNLSTGEKTRFRGQCDASRFLGIQQANIWKVLNKQRDYAGGYYFEYLERGNCNE